MALTREQKNQALDIFETPVMFRPEALLMLSEQELEMILMLGKEPYYEVELQKMLAPIAKYPDALIWSAYSRAVLNKVRDENNELMYEVTNFYARYPYFAQFEFQEYARIPRERRTMMNDWDYEVYANIWREAAQQRIDDYDVFTPDGDFMTLEQAIDLVKNQEFIALVPCNCKYMMDATDKPRNVCTHFHHGENSAWDRGHGQRVTPEHMIELLKEFNSKGLMPNGKPEEGGFCNCDGESCYPLRLGRELGGRGHNPRPYWTIHWDESKCVSCGKCAKICNYQAFTVGANGKVSFHPGKCWGCTICTNNCPKGAITKTPIEWNLKKPEKKGKAEGFQFVKIVKARPKKL